MRKIAFILAFSLWAVCQGFKQPHRAISSIEADDCDLSHTEIPHCWKARSEAVVKILLVHYGDELDQKKLASIAVMFEKRFYEASAKKIKIEVVESLILPLRKMERDLDNIRKNVGGDLSRTDKKRLERLWYYYQDISIPGEIHEELLSKHKDLLAQVDGVAVLSAPQFDGLGYLSGAYAMVEFPTEIAWKGTDGGSTLYDTDYRVVDELVHETGHLLGLDHVADQCSDLPYKERNECCSQSAGKSDVMSYCRDRDKVSATFNSLFTACSIAYLNESSIPSLLSGGKRLFQNELCP